MRIAIIGPKERVESWEDCFRSYRTVRQVTTVTTGDEPFLLPDQEWLGDADACLLLDDSPAKLANVRQVVRLGLPVYLVSRLSFDVEGLRQIQLSSEEAGVPVQFSHWPTFSASTQAMRQRVHRPRWFHARRILPLAAYTESVAGLAHAWMDEVALAGAWIDSRLLRVDVDAPDVAGRPTGVHVRMAFENGAAAVVDISLIGGQPVHSRVAQDAHAQVECDVLEQRVMTLDPHGPTSRSSFDARETARLSVGRFLKAAGHRGEAAFSVHDALRAAEMAAAIRKKL